MFKIFPIIQKAGHLAHDFCATRGRHLFCLHPKIRLNYYTAELNFGDILNKDLMRFFGCDYCHVRSRYANVACIGSLLQQYLLSSSKSKSTEPLHVFGSGFIKEAENAQEAFYRPMIFHALRGQLSQKRCAAITGQNLDDLPLGDPGLLIKYIFPDIQVNPEYDVGIICHYADKDSPYLKNIQIKNLNVCSIDISQPTKNFVQQVAKCRFILSSALHGLICADSLGIPNQHIILGEKVVGGEYKFKDYYSVFKNVVYHPISLKESMITDKDIQNLTKQYAIQPDEVEAICQRLIQAFSAIKDCFGK